MTTPAMKPGNKTRKDQHQSHLALVSFGDREQEARWIAQAVRILVPSEAEGALHDKPARQEGRLPPGAHAFGRGRPGPLFHGRPHLYAGA